MVSIVDKMLGSLRSGWIGQLPTRGGVIYSRRWRFLSWRLEHSDHKPMLITCSDTEGDLLIPSVVQNLRLGGCWMGKW
jgi:hypothetical protein